MFDLIWQTVLEAWRLSRGRRLALAIAVLMLAAGLANCLFATGMVSALTREDGVIIPKGFSFIGERSDGRMTPMQGFDALAVRNLALPELKDLSIARTSRFSLVTPTGSAQNAVAVNGLWVDGPLFKSLGWTMQLGRDFADSDFRGDYLDVQGSDAVIVTHSLWQRELGASANVIGQVLVIEGAQRTIVGVLPPNRAYPSNQKVYLPFKLSAARAFRDATHTPQYFQLFTPIKDQTAHNAVRGALKNLENGRLARMGRSAKDNPLDLESMTTAGINEETRLIMWTLNVVAWLVLLLAAVNAGGLLLVNYLSRLPELATRAALGSSYWRLMAAVLTQSAALVLLAFTVARLSDRLGLPYFESLLHERGMVPVYVQFVFRPSMILPSLLSCLFATLVVAFPVLMRIRPTQLMQQLRSDSRTHTGAGKLGIGLLLVQCMVSVAAVLIAVTSINGADHAMSRDYGIKAPNVVVAQFASTNPVQLAESVTRIAAALRAKSEFDLVSVSQVVPQVGNTDRRVVLGDQLPMFNYLPADEYFAEMYGIAMRQGRWLTQADRESKAAVAVIDVTAAVAAFGTTEAIGRQITILGVDEVQRQAVTVVGITEAVTVDAEQGADKPSLFVPIDPNAPLLTFVQARTRSNNPAAFIKQVREVANLTAPNVAIESVKTYQKAFYDSNFGFRLIGSMFAPMGILAVLFAAVGLAGLLGNLVARRLRESAIRSSLGASASQVLWPLLRPLWLTVAAGLVLGSVIAWPLAQSISELLFGGDALDLRALLIALSLILVALALACFLPARRALLADPIEVLKRG